ncbi:Probable transcriptional regulatory protein [Galdieria sulphuraria]|nr:Probable transcriptional regulatory protein [Galdieria sulphuraria]
MLKFAPLDDLFIYVKNFRYLSNLLPQLEIANGLGSVPALPNLEEWIPSILKMAGHSKWHNIKHQKARADAKRSQNIAKISRSIISAVREAGEDPAKNVKLAVAIERAKSLDVPKDKIQSAIKSGLGVRSEAELEAVRYEGYGPGGIAILVEALTGNRNRTAAQVRHLFNKYEGSLGSPGSVDWMFEKLGVIRFSISEDTSLLDKLEEAAIDLNAKDVEVVESSKEAHMTCNPDQFFTILESLKERSFVFESADVLYRPKNMISLSIEEDLGKKVNGLIEALEDDEDVENVAHAANFT